jgi:demethylmenaquinone methyltransferase/2-methoxy-6-polyprenyl-1,4-benzoquinol methylase
LQRSIAEYFVDRDVLEIACGTGYWTQFIAPVARSVTATDINAETLAIAETKPFPPDRVKLQVADIYDLAPEYKNFTGAFAGFWWSHLRRADRRSFINTLHRALKRGAIVVALDNLYIEGSSTPISHTDAEGNTYQRRRLADGSEHTVLKNFPMESELRSDLEHLGSSIEFITYDYYWILKYEVAA